MCYKWALSEKINKGELNRYELGKFVYKTTGLDVM